MSTRSGSPILETLGLFAVVFVLQQLVGLISAGLFAGLFVLTPPLETNPWTIVTSVYAHAGLGHLLSNSVALALFGWPVARATTRGRFHVFFVVTGALAGVSQVVIGHVVASVYGLGVVQSLAGLPGGSWLLAQFHSLVVMLGGTSPGVLGASGAVFALMGYLLTGNRLSEGLASRIRLPTWATLLVFAIVAVAITLFTYAPQVALVAHFVGFFFGLIAGRAGVLHTGSSDTSRRQPV